MAKARTRRGSGGPDTRLTDISYAPAERWTHGADYDVGPVDEGDVVARRVQKVSGPVDGLRRSGRILDAEVGAAGRWVADYERSLRSSYVDPATASIHGSGGRNSGPEARWLGGISAATRLAQVREALGRDAEVLLVRHVHHAVSLRASVQAATGSLSGTAVARVAERLATVLRELAAHYEEADRQSADGVLRPRAVAEGGQGMAA